ncbi:hypothetical protein [Hyphococcus sp. DH-69]|uniref:hypothetical protein n=1 Tax=Hyphococcus formosus TaxID=3143534 RepID=UPI00398B9EE9
MVKIIGGSAAVALFAGLSAAFYFAGSPVEAVQPKPDVPPLSQVGPWYPATFNIEEPYINILHASSLEWSGDDKNTKELLEGGYIDPSTGLPVELPNGKTLTTGVYFTGNSDVQKGHWDGEWVLEWEGKADLSILYLPKELQWRASKNRIEFTRDFKGGKTPYHAAIQVKRLKEPLKDLRIYRKENEKALRAGKVFTPKFTNAVGKYDIVRSMDLQETNRAAVRSIDDLPGENAPFWGNIAYINNPSHKPPYRSAPLEPIFKMAVEADNMLWTHVPITLGAPLDIFDSEVIVPDFGGWAGNYRKLVRENPEQVLASPEWDRYADHFVESLIDSGYPADRTLYVTISNEVWNFAGQYFLTTQYAWGLGEGFGPKLGIPGGYNRTGYGVASAHWKLALDKALKKAGRDQKVIYVIEGQAVNPATTYDALNAAKAYMEHRGENWSDHAGSFGVSVASYWGSHEFTKFRIDANDLQSIEEWLVGGPDNHLATLKAVIKYFRTHADEAKKFGVPFIGAYEGGSHFNRPKDMDKDRYTEFMWGKGGYAGRINRAVNEALAAEFPGVILSNYVLAGAKSDAYFEGPLGADNSYAKSWEPFLRKTSPEE